MRLINSLQRWKGVALVLAAALTCQAVEPNPAVSTPAFTNRLAREKSPYLIQHQHNPVDWYPWGEEAFAKAKAEDKPIFLSVGYSTCHWCHVMAHESFESAEIAKLMNALFVCVKVDREERPDVDRVYMTYVQATTGSGGWPMSVFLTPDLKPFFGGTYFPPADRGGRPGFPTVLQRLADIWKDDRARVVEAAAGAMQALGEYAARGGEKSEAVGREALAAALDQLGRTFDDENGGFGSAPKFPRPSTLNLLLRIYAREGADARDGKIALGTALETLRRMAAGGMNDQLGGGFHRYSVDRFWHVPHFEKMLYDQAQLAVTYLDAFQITRDAELEKTARATLDYVRREMTDKDGGFYSAEDADSLIAHGKPEHAEGAFYVWKETEIETALGEEPAKIFNRVYGVDPAGNAPEGSDPMKEFTGANILIRRLTLAEAAKAFQKSEAEIATSLASSKKILFDLRAKRPRPHLDDKIITAWNGLMISAFARGAQVLDDPAYLVAAQRAVKFIREKLSTKDGKLLRNYRQGASTVEGFAEDYAYLIQGLLDLYEADFDPGHLQWALELQVRMNQLFGDAEHGGFFNVVKDAPHILLRMKEDHDGAEPAPSSVAALNLLRLAQLTGQEDFRARALKTLAAFADQLTKAPTALPQMLVALDASLAKPRQIVIAGPRDSDITRALLREAHARFLPNKLVILADGGPGQQWLGERLEFIKTVGPIDGKPAAYVCEDFVCQLPVTDPVKLREQLGK